MIFGKGFDHVEAITEDDVVLVLLQLEIDDLNENRFRVGALFGESINGPI